MPVRDDRWSEAIAVGSLALVEMVKRDLGIRAMHRDVIKDDGRHALREPAEAYAGGFIVKMALYVGKHFVLRMKR